MQTIVEPKQHIDKLWGKQRVREDKTYRLMKYVLRVDHRGKVLLHNVVTGRLAVLDQEEAAILDKLPIAYSSVIGQLVTEHYLVPEECDEHQQVVNLRSILRQLDESQRRTGFQHYVILPTTACNARCYYCFEQGTESFTMTKRIASDVVRFITSHSIESKKISIMWFGGEPTVAADRIDQISEGLRTNGISYMSTMISNAYLFDERMVDRAKKLWNLKRIQISVDGTENNYNDVKNFVGSRDNPYKRVMRNIGMLLDNEIRVDLRMNYDLNNYMDFVDLLNEVIARFKDCKYIQVYAYPVIGEYPDKNGKLLHGNDEWRSQTAIELNRIAREIGLHHYSDELPNLTHAGCGADTYHSITINAKGDLVECPEHFDERERVGTVNDGITNNEKVLAWRELADYSKCRQCAFFPRCVRLRRCSAGENCYYYDRNQQFLEAVKRRFSAWEDNGQINKGGE